MSRYASCENSGAVSVEALRALAHMVLKILRSFGEPGEPARSDAHLVAVVARFEPRLLHQLLQLSLPALAILGHDDLAKRIQDALQRPAAS